ncbi:hypothetical protein [Ferroacidibacillus organovorans]|uniref:Uncharacterized protein n=1 Tax=Ferroacidibacillus organovorans TaxID=1765683 RepID=A0A101XTJ6_9BACL|nr:hypothetical protein [Ferroacidibacillus organovorans]KUO97260.1 hypothetical protein ATW55_11755 [Ferroacidibacillus organovorans]
MTDFLRHLFGEGHHAVTKKSATAIMKKSATVIMKKSVTAIMEKGMEFWATFSDHEMMAA